MLAGRGTGACCSLLFPAAAVAIVVVLVAALAAELELAGIRQLPARVGRILPTEGISGWILAVVVVVMAADGRGTVDAVVVAWKELLVVVVAVMELACGSCC